MAKKLQKQPHKQQSTIGLGTAIAGVVVALVIGFYLGTLFSTLSGSGKSSSGGSGVVSNQGTPMPEPGPPSGPSPAELARIAELERTVAASPQDGAAWTELGNRYFDSDQPVKAIAAYTKSLEITPNEPNVWTDLGVMYRSAGQFQEAVRAFDQAAFLDKGHETARFNKGIVLLHDLNDEAGALKAWEDLLAINPQATAPTGTPVTAMVDDLREHMAGHPAETTSPAAPQPLPKLAPITAKPKLD